MVGELIWCDTCRCAIEKEQLLHYGSAYACPKCRRSLFPAAMIRAVCPDCGRTLLHTEAAVFRCPCKAGQNCPDLGDTVPIAEEKSTAPAKSMGTRSGLPPVFAAEALTTGLGTVSASDSGEARALSWTPSSPWCFAYEHPDGAALRVGDAAIAAPGQCVRYRTGGKVLWSSEPGTLPLYYDGRELQDMLLGQLHGVGAGSVTPMVNTQVVFFDLHRHDGLHWWPQEGQILPGRVSVKTEWTFSLMLTDPEMFMSRSCTGQAPSAENIRARVYGRMQEAAGSWLKNRWPTSCNQDAVQEVLSREGAEMARQMEEAIGADDEYGLLLENLVLTRFEVQGNLCPRCFRPVTPGMMQCVCGQRIGWCPVCGAMLTDGKCPQGHAIYWCPYCGGRGQYRAEPDGRCPIHGIVGGTR